MSKYYIQTGRTTTIDLETPSPYDIDKFSMFEALSNMTRFNGLSAFYSVAEHLVLGTRHLDAILAPVEVQRAYLFHDAHEAYTGDVLAPIKRLPELREGFGKFEARMQRVVWRWLEDRAEVVAPTHHLVRETDLRMCVTEAEQLYGELLGDGWPDVTPIPLDLEFWEPREAAAEMIEEARRLGVW